MGWLRSPACLLEDCSDGFPTAFGDLMTGTSWDLCSGGHCPGSLGRLLHYLFDLGEFSLIFNLIIAYRS